MTYSARNTGSLFQCWIEMMATSVAWAIPFPACFNLRSGDGISAGLHKRLLPRPSNAMRWRPIYHPQRQDVLVFTPWRARWLLGLIIALLIGAAAAPVSQKACLTTLPAHTSLAAGFQRPHAGGYPFINCASFKGRQTGTPDDLASAEFVKAGF